MKLLSKVVTVSIMLLLLVFAVPAWATGEATVTPSVSPEVVVSAFLPFERLTIPTNGNAVARAGGKEFSIPLEAARKVQATRAKDGLSDLTKATVARVRARKANTIYLGCATGYLKLSGTYNKGVLVLTGYSWWNFADGVPEWIDWAIAGTNRTFNRSFSHEWSEGDLGQNYKPLEYGAWEGGGNYFTYVRPNSWVMSNEGFCVLTTASLYEYANVGW